jgi:putative DNA primase/helicase
MSCENANGGDQEVHVRPQSHSRVSRRRRQGKPNGKDGGSDDPDDGLAGVYGQRAGNSSHSGTGTKASPLYGFKSSLRIDWLTDVQAENLRWLWPGRFALGKYCLIGGESELGKSTLLDTIAALITRGLPWPDGRGNAPQGSVIILSAEDDIADTIKPRIMAAGGDPDKVFVIRGKADAKGKATFNLQQDLSDLEQLIRHLGDVRLVILDPIASYFGGGKDSHKNTDTRMVLEPLLVTAADIGVCVIGLTHTPKGSDNVKRKDRFQGSTAFQAAARVAYLVEAILGDDDEDTGQRVFAKAKNNLAQDTQGIGYHIEGADVECDGIVIKDVARIVWDGPLVWVPSIKCNSKLNDAKAFLRKVLAEGDLPVKQIYAAAKAEGISSATLERAKAIVAVSSRRPDDGVPCWRLVADDDTAQTTDDDETSHHHQGS